jgi:hypothetical protein
MGESTRSKTIAGPGQSWPRTARSCPAATRRAGKWFPRVRHSWRRCSVAGRVGARIRSAHSSAPGWFGGTRPACSCPRRRSWPGPPPSEDARHERRSEAPGPPGVRPPAGDPPPGRCGSRSRPEGRSDRPAAPDAPAPRPRRPRRVALSSAPRGDRGRRSPSRRARLDPSPIPPAWRSPPPRCGDTRSHRWSRVRRQLVKGPPNGGKSLKPVPLSAPARSAALTLAITWHAPQAIPHRAPETQTHDEPAAQGPPSSAARSRCAGGAGVLILKSAIRQCGNAVASAGSRC